MTTLLYFLFLLLVYVWKLIWFLDGLCFGKCNQTSHIIWYWQFYALFLKSSAANKRQWKQSSWKFWCKKTKTAVCLCVQTVIWTTKQEQPTDREHMQTIYSCDKPFNRRPWMIHSINVSSLSWTVSSTMTNRTLLLLIVKDPGFL